MQPNLFEKSLDLNTFINITELQNFFIISKLKLISQKQNFLNRIKKKKIGKISFKS